MSDEVIPKAVIMLSLLTVMTTIEHEPSKKEIGDLILRLGDGGDLVLRERQRKDASDG